MNYKKINKLTTILLIAGLIICGWFFRHSMNADAVAYLRIAKYYADGNLSMAINSYWGPLFSWMVAPLLLLGIEPLISARIIMAISAIIFYFACDHFFKRCGVKEEWGAAGRLVAGVASLIWSVQQITPDLLMSGLLTLAAAKIIPDNRNANGYNWLFTGAFLGLSFLAKPVAFPISILFIALFVMIVFVCERHKFFSALKAAIKIFAVFLAISALWITAVSMKYGKFTISSSAVIAHAIVGPELQEHVHPFATQFHTPEQGRVTNWEDPVSLPYKYWSPISSLSNFLYQLKLIGRNLLIVVALLLLLHPVVAFLVFASLRWFFKWGETDYLSSMSWFRLLLPVFAICIVYLPVWVSIKDVRYFYPVLPFVFGSVALFFSMRVEPWKLKRPGLVRYLPLLLAIGTVLTATVPSIVQTVNSYKAGVCAQKIASGISSSKLVGNIAGSGLIRGGRIGLFVAFLLDRQWLGDSTNPTLDDIKKSGATIFITSSGTPLEKLLNSSNLFEDITPQTTNNSTADCQIHVFKLKDTAS
ncbi:MAG: hypothetical protein N2487_05720 [Verrucomicrobiae bacterium]|nr:hypothetical protein [Verrucomicrobiae bacterium]